MNQALYFCVYHKECLLLRLKYYHSLIVFPKRLHNVKSNNQFLHHSAVAGGANSVQQRRVQNAGVSQIDFATERYGFTDEEYRAYVEAGQESARLCDDTHYYLSHSPNVPTYLY